MKASFIVSIPVKDKSGRVVGHKQVVRYEGLLAKAHEDGLKSVSTVLVQAPCADNGDVAIVRATVETCRGTFDGIGDASPSNVNPRVTGHLLRVAETRAKARALRDAVNIGIVALDELEDVDETDASDSQPPPAVERASSASNGAVAANANVPTPPPEMRDDLMTSAQRRLLFRIAAERGVATDDIGKWLENHVGLKSIKTWSKADASRLIEKLKANGHANGASP
jgi:hypothetical protein